MKITPSILLHAYQTGLFPMADSAQASDLFWCEPEQRGIIPLDERFHIPRRLARTMRHTPLTMTHDHAFADVMQLCSMEAPDRKETWINAEIHDLYRQLHQQGHAHSVEIYDRTTLVGGLYGVHIGGAFFGESMFSRKTDASKIALVYLVQHLRTQGFSLLDTQFLTNHLAQFGAIEIPKKEYNSLLLKAILENCEY